MARRPTNPIDPACLLTDARPEAGDILISAVDGAVCRYALSVVPHPPQVAYREFDEAAARAKHFAIVEEVDVWTDGGEGAYALVATYRLPRGI